MDMSLILETLLPSLDRSIAHNKKYNETTCNALCQHPGCWASVRRQQKGIARAVSPVDTSSDDSDSDLDLPKQAICNLLDDYGESTSDRYPLSTGGRPSHQWEPNSRTITRSSRSLDSVQQFKVPHNTKGSLFSKSTAGATKRRPRMPLVEVQEVFDKTDLNSQWDETFVTKQYYMWVPNPRKGPRESLEMPGSRETYRSMPLLLKDLTECMVPAEIEQKREDTIIFDDMPVLKKKQQRTRSPPPRKPVHFKKAPILPIAPPETDLDTEGINELLALPKDALMKVLEHTKKSDFSSKGKLHSILQEYVQYDERARMALNTHELFQPRKMPILQQPISRVEQTRPPIFHLDSEMILDRMSSVNSPVKEKDSVSDAHSVDSYPRYKKPLPGIQEQASLGKHTEAMVDSNSSMRFLGIKPKIPRIPSISLGLPELPSGVKTTRPFSYSKKSFVDFSLGPVISPPSTVRSSYSADYSDHGTTVKVHAPTSAADFMAEERMGDYAIHSVSPALSTHVPHPPAVTPATYMSPTKSAPVFRDYKDLSREPTSITASQKAMPPSRDVRETTLLSFMPSDVSQRQTLSPMDTKLIETPDELALDTINETAREGMDGSILSSHRATADDVELPCSGRKDEMAALALEPSALTSINTNASPLLKSARSVESCPSPEQWPLISESSFENMMPRPSVSEPALSARTRHLSARGLDDDLQVSDRDYARKVLDEKMTAESPAPPPPSPEPKDREFRSRKDLKSRDSLSMAPLFEVSEVEEGSPVQALGEREYRMKRGRDGDRRMKQVRQIHAIIPQAKIETDKKEDDEECEDMMVSQITVTHITPKGPDANVKKGEKVQETFLNVDIPAEEISSLRGEHGSSHQEDISSNDTVVQSNSTTTGSEVSALAAGQTSEHKEEDAEKDDVSDVANEKQITDITDSYNVLSKKDKSLVLDHGGQQMDYPAKEQSEDSVISPELMCDSARFLNHDLVSPVDGELEEDRASWLLPLLNENAADEDGIMDRHTGRSSAEGTNHEKRTNGEAVGELEAEKTGIINEEIDGEKVVDSLNRNDSNDEEGMTTDMNEGEIEPPGSFFFRESSSSTSLKDNVIGSEKSQEAGSDNTTRTESQIDGQINMANEIKDDNHITEAPEKVNVDIEKDSTWEQAVQEGKELKVEEERENVEGMKGLEKEEVSGTEEVGAEIKEVVGDEENVDGNDNDLDVEKSVERKADVDVENDEETDLVVAETNNEGVSDKRSAVNDGEGGARVVSDDKDNEIAMKDVEENGNLPLGDSMDVDSMGVGVDQTSKGDNDDSADSTVDGVRGINTDIPEDEARGSNDGAGLQNPIGSDGEIDGDIEVKDKSPEALQSRLEPEGLET